MKVKLKTGPSVVATVDFPNGMEPKAGEQIFLDEKNQGNVYVVESTRTRVTKTEWGPELFLEVFLVPRLDKRISDNPCGEIPLTAKQPCSIETRNDDEDKPYAFLRKLENEAAKMSNVRDYLKKVIEYSDLFLKSGNEDEKARAYYRVRKHLSDYLLRIEMGEDYNGQD